MFSFSDSAKQKISDEKAIKRAEQEMEKVEEQMEASVNKVYVRCKFVEGGGQGGQKVASEGCLEFPALQKIQCVIPVFTPS